MSQATLSKPLWALWAGLSDGGTRHRAACPSMASTSESASIAHLFAQPKTKE